MPHYQLSHLDLLEHEAIHILRETAAQFAHAAILFSGGKDSLRDYSFRDQLRRAGVSIMNNIAEGFERHSDADFAHFLTIAKGSSGEVRSMLYLGEDRQYFAPEQANRLRSEAAALSGGLSKLSSYLRSKKS